VWPGPATKLAQVAVLPHVVTTSGSPARRRGGALAVSAPRPRRRTVGGTNTSVVRRQRWLLWWPALGQGGEGGEEVLRGLTEKGKGERKERASGDGQLAFYSSTAEVGDEPAEVSCGCKGAEWR
jgi:xanthine/CO dehydrogenase XdhC/CoxF family maturation factor